jgi:hypothetical protein
MAVLLVCNADCLVTRHRSGDSMPMPAIACSMHVMQFMQPPAAVLALEQAFSYADLR